MAKDYFLCYKSSDLLGVVPLPGIYETVDNRSYIPEWTEKVWSYSAAVEGLDTMAGLETRNKQHYEPEKLLELMSDANKEKLFNDFFKNEDFKKFDLILRDDKKVLKTVYSNLQDMPIENAVETLKELFYQNYYNNVKGDELIALSKKIVRVENNNSEEIKNIFGNNDLNVVKKDLELALTAINKALDENATVKDVKNVEKMKSYFNKGSDGIHL